MFNYKIEFRGDSSTAILIAPNGYGKTAFLSVLNACLQFRLYDAVEYRFDELSVEFEDGARWSFKRTKFTEEDIPGEGEDRVHRMRIRRRRQGESFIKFTSYDEKGKQKKEKESGGIESIPRQVLLRAIDSHLPVSRLSADSFKDFRSGEVLRFNEIFERYKGELLSDPDFRAQIGDYAPYLLKSADQKLNCVFIETQRLLQTRITARADNDAARPQEEILHQAAYLASLLQRTYASYAATSQDLDRSFPNRLVSRSERSKSYDIKALKGELDAIEAKRRALTDAGILVDTSEPLVAPKDEFIKNVADALEIYVEDSKKKLSTFDEIFSKVSVFRDLLSKKLRPKSLGINRENGAEVRRGKDLVELDKLSSGEKHEFIMLFRLIFETPPLSLVLIDEPEISLHVSWQLEFMSDLGRIQSANSFQCIIATHSPQIIQGAEDITFDLSEQAK
ncbi:MAG: AAA family ATPase [Candidatus Pacebacteria bacterium]|nr:AAA family ATPase [Candidatus Paceibacterota bacterium]